MNEYELMEQEINQQIKILDGFQHPSLSAELAGTITRSMAGQYRRHSIFRNILRIGIPMAAAAGLALAAWISFSAQSVCVNPKNGVQTTSIWSFFAESQSKDMDTLFADLDFSTVATQPVATQNIDETVEEMDQYLMDMMNKS